MWRGDCILVVENAVVVSGVISEVLGESFVAGRASSGAEAISFAGLNAP